MSLEEQRIAIEARKVNSPNLRQLLEGRKADLERIARDFETEVGSDRWCDIAAYELALWAMDVYDKGPL